MPYTATHAVMHTFPARLGYFKGADNLESLLPFCPLSVLLSRSITHTYVLKLDAEAARSMSRMPHLSIRTANDDA